jgi:hypothetical protein
MGHHPEDTLGALLEALRPAFTAPVQAPSAPRLPAAVNDPTLNTRYGYRPPHCAIGGRCAWEGPMQVPEDRVGLQERAVSVMYFRGETKPIQTFQYEGSPSVDLLDLSGFSRVVKYNPHGGGGHHMLDQHRPRVSLARVSRVKVKFFSVLI